MLMVVAAGMTIVMVMGDFDLIGRLGREPSPASSPPLLFAARLPDLGQRSRCALLVGLVGGRLQWRCW